MDSTTALAIQENDNVVIQRGKRNEGRQHLQDHLPGGGPGRAAEFYETIGFRRCKEEADRVTFYVNWFFVTLVGHDDAEVPAKGERLFLYFVEECMSLLEGMPEQIRVLPVGGKVPGG